MNKVLLCVALSLTSLSASAQLMVTTYLRGVVVAADQRYAGWEGQSFTNRIITSATPFLRLERSVVYSAYTRIDVGGEVLFETENFQADYVDIWKGGSLGYGLTQSSRGDLGHHYGFRLLGPPQIVDGDHLSPGVSFPHFDVAEGWLSDATGSLQFSIESYEVHRPLVAVPEPAAMSVLSVLALTGLIAARIYTGGARRLRT